MNFLDVQVENRDGQIWLNEGKFSLKLAARHQTVAKNYVGKSLTCGIRPEDILDRRAVNGGSVEGRIATSTIEVVEPMGSEVLLYLSTGKNTLIARAEPQSDAKVNQEMQLVFNMEKVHLFDKEASPAWFKEVC